MEKSTRVYVWDMTLNFEQEGRSEIIEKWMRKECKKWGYQHERIEWVTKPDFNHWQARFSLKNKMTKFQLMANMPWKLGSRQLSVTSNACRGPNFYDYVCKDKSFVVGTRKCDKDVIMPRQLRKIKELKPWQQDLWDLCQIPDDDYINCIIDPAGWNGKTAIAGLMEFSGLAFFCPPVSEAKDMMQIMYGAHKQGYKLDCIIIDVPRAWKTNKYEADFWMAIEMLKRGKIYDQRYTYRQEWIDSPSLWVMINRKPNLECITLRRWKLWGITPDGLRPWVVVYVGNK